MDTATKTRPISFRPELVRAILEGRKTQTRRLVKPQPVYIPSGYDSSAGWLWPPGSEPGEDGAWWGVNAPPDAPTWCMQDFCKYGEPGDRLWVKETWSMAYIDDMQRIVYRADMPSTKNVMAWKSPRFMPRAASRLTLELTAVRVERLQDISEADCCADMGCPVQWDGEGPEPYVRDLRTAFAHLWDSINSKPGTRWQDNPWVWVLSFQEVNHER